MESIWVKLREGKTKSVVVGICYRPSDQGEDIDAALLGQLDRIPRQQDLMIMGDFNFLEVCWGMNSAKQPES